MSRQGDLPPVLGQLYVCGRVPAAVVGVGVVVNALAMSGSVGTNWAFNSFTVLIYYALTNLTALQLPKEAQRYPRAFASAGLTACLFLAFWVPPRIWAAGLVLVGAGLLWHRLAPRLWGGCHR